MRKNILSLYFYWYFVEMPRLLAYIWGNIIVFIFDYFTVYGLWKTLFWPYKRYRQYMPKPFNLTAFFEMIVFNGFSRMIGFFIRTITIAIGLLAEFFVLIFGSFIYLFWLILPFLLIALIILGIKMII